MTVCHNLEEESSNFYNNARAHFLYGIAYAKNGFRVPKVPVVAPVTSWGASRQKLEKHIPSQAVHVMTCGIDSEHEC